MVLGRFLPVVFASMMSLPATAGVAVWTGSSGWFPNEVNEAWTLQNTSDLFTPVLAGGKLTLNTGAEESDAYMAYSMQGADIKYPRGQAYFAEAVVRPGPGGSSSPYRGQVTIVYYFPNGNAAWFGLTTTKMFILKELSQFGDIRTDLDTAAFHRYRIEVEGQNEGDIVTVYQDGVQVMQAPGVFFNGGSAKRLAFGDYTIAAYGKSEWKSFKTNIAACKEPKIIVNC